MTIGWLRGVYPAEKTAEDSIHRGDMFVQEDQTGEIVGTGIITLVTGTKEKYFVKKYYTKS